MAGHDQCCIQHEAVVLQFAASSEQWTDVSIVCCWCNCRVPWPCRRRSCRGGTAAPQPAAHRSRQLAVVRVLRQCHIVQVLTPAASAELCCFDNDTCRDQHASGTGACSYMREAQRVGASVCAAKVAAC